MTRPLALAALLLLPAGPALAQEAPGLGLPVTCALGTECFVQQFPDMDAGPGASDPFCGSASYDGHDGIDIRVRSMRDVERGVAAVASAAGTVRGVRDGVEDRLAMTDELRAAVRGTECGNGVVLDHGGGLETQYCHLRRGSVAVRTGERVEAGRRLGDIGASGDAQFPHVHFSVRRNGERIDPVTGRAVGSGCASGDAREATLFAPEAAEALAGPATAILDFGLAGAPVDYDRLVLEGGPPVPAAGAPATIAWGWFANLRAGDRVAFRIAAPDGSAFFEGEGEPLPRNQAAYSSFAGRSRALGAGRWEIRVEVRRDGASVAEGSRTVEVAG